MVDQEVLDKLEAGFAKLQASDSKSLLKKHLTREVFDACKNRKTAMGATLQDVIQSGKFERGRIFYQEQLAVRHRIAVPFACPFQPAVLF